MRAMLATAAAALALGASLVAGVPAARAGEWVQVSCVNPNGSGAPSQGWTAFSTGSSFGAVASTTCAPGSPMQAALSSGAPAPVYESAGIMYTPPPGSALIGGKLGLLLSGDGAGTNANGDAYVDEPDQQPSDARIRCAEAGSKGCGSSGSDFNGNFTLPANLGGDLYVVAGCDGQAGFSCDTGGRYNAWAIAHVTSADLLLQNNATPTASRVPRSALRSPLRHTAHLLVKASDTDGPGVYEITAAIDGTTVSRTYPSSNGGACVPVGTDKTSGALEFDAAQPCLQTVSARIPIPSAKAPDGTHTLQVIVHDAAGNTTTVLSRTVTIDNARETPAPAQGLHARFLIGWDWDHAVTSVVSARARHVPGNGHVALSCTGGGCPTLHSGPVAAGGVKGLLNGLQGVRFRAGDRLLITVTAPHHAAERVQLTIRDGHRPRAALLS